jgi:hypothetical protein
MHFRHSQVGRGSTYTLKVNVGRTSVDPAALIVVEVCLRKLIQQGGGELSCVYVGGGVVCIKHQRK